MLVWFVMVPGNYPTETFREASNRLSPFCFKVLMRKDHILVLGIFAAVIIVIGGLVWLANAPLQPTAQSTHLVLSDERIPR